MIRRFVSGCLVGSVLSFLFPCSQRVAFAQEGRAELASDSEAIRAVQRKVEEESIQQERRLLDLEKKYSDALTAHDAEIAELKKEAADSKWDVLGWVLAALGVLGVGSYVTLNKTLGHLLRRRLTRDVLARADDHIAHACDAAKISILLNIAQTYWVTHKASYNNERAIVNRFCLRIVQSARRTIDRVHKNQRSLLPDQLLQAANAKGQEAYYLAEQHFLGSRPEATNEQKRAAISEAKSAWETVAELREKKQLPVAVTNPDAYVDGCEETYAWCLHNFGHNDEQTEARKIAKRILKKGSIQGEDREYLLTHYKLTEQEIASP